MILIIMIVIDSYDDMVIITLNNGIYQRLEDQELLLGHTQPLKAVDYQHALQKIVLALSNPY